MYVDSTIMQCTVLLLLQFGVLTVYSNLYPSTYMPNVLELNAAQDMLLCTLLCFLHVPSL